MTRNDGISQVVAQRTPTKNIFAKYAGKLYKAVSGATHNKTESITSSLPTSKNQPHGYEVHRQHPLREGRSNNIPTKHSAPKEAWVDESTSKHTQDAKFDAKQLQPVQSITLDSVSEEPDNLETNSVFNYPNSPRSSVGSVAPNQTLHKKKSTIPTGNNPYGIEPELSVFRMRTSSTPPRTSMDSGFGSPRSSLPSSNSVTSFDSKTTDSYSIGTAEQLTRSLQTEQYRSASDTETNSQKIYKERAEASFKNAKNISYTDDERKQYFADAIKSAEYATALGSAPAANLLLQFLREGIRQVPGSQKYLIEPGEQSTRNFWMNVTSALGKNPSHEKALKYQEGPILKAATLEETKWHITPITAPTKKMEALIEISRAIHGHGGSYTVDYIKQWHDAFQTIKNDDATLPIIERPTIPKFVWDRRESLKRASRNTYL